MPLYVGQYNIKYIIFRYKSNVGENGTLLIFIWF